MAQLQLFTRSEVAAMRDRSRARNYSPEGEEFRRVHARHRSWGLARRHARKLCRSHGCSTECAAVGLHDSADVPPLIWPAGATRERPPSESGQSPDIPAERGQRPDPHHCDDRAEPADQPMPASRTKTVAPANSAESAERTSLTDRAEPAQRTEPTDRTASAKRTGPAKRTESVERSGPSRRREPRVVRGARPTATGPTTTAIGTPRAARTLHPRHDARNHRRQAGENRNSKPENARPPPVVRTNGHLTRVRPGSAEN